MITRWGTWLDAAIYYANNFESVQTVINSFDTEASQSIEAAKDLMQLPSIKRELAFIKRNYTCLTVTLTSMQRQGCSLSDGIGKFLNIRDQLNGHQNATVRKKFDDVMQKNKGLDILRTILTYLEDPEADDSTACDFVRNLSPNELNAYAFAPVTSCDVERTFSSYKYIFSEQRRSFTFENLKQHLVIHCNDF